MSDDDDEIVTGRQKRSHLNKRGKNRLRTLADTDSEDEDGFEEVQNDSEEDDDDGDDSEENILKPAVKDSIAYRPDRLVEAISNLEPYLDPRPSIAKKEAPATWEAASLIVKKQGLKLKQLDQLVKFLSSPRNSKKITLELKCFVIAVARHTCRMLSGKSDTKKAQELFRSRDKNDKSNHLANYVSNKWLQESFKETQDITSPTEDTIEADNMHLNVINESFLFMTEAFVIDNDKKLEVLKEKQNIDWKGMADSVFKFGMRRRVNALSHSAGIAKKHFSAYQNKKPADQNAGEASNSAIGTAVHRNSIEDMAKKKREERMANLRKKAVVQAGVGLNRSSSVTGGYSSAGPDWGGSSANENYSSNKHAEWPSSSASGNTDWGNPAPSSARRNGAESSGGSKQNDWGTAGSSSRYAHQGDPAESSTGDLWGKPEPSSGSDWGKPVESLTNSTDWGKLSGSVAESPSTNNADWGKAVESTGKTSSYSTERGKPAESATGNSSYNTEWGKPADASGGFSSYNEEWGKPAVSTGGSSYNEEWRKPAESTGGTASYNEEWGKPAESKGGSASYNEEWGKPAESTGKPTSYTEEWGKPAEPSVRGSSSYSEEWGKPAESAGRSSSYNDEWGKPAASTGRQDEERGKPTEAAARSSTYQEEWGKPTEAAATSSTYNEEWGKPAESTAESSSYNGEWGRHPESTIPAESTVHMSSYKVEWGKPPGESTKPAASTVESSSYNVEWGKPPESMKPAESLVESSSYNVEWGKPPESTRPSEAPVESSSYNMEWGKASEFAESSSYPPPSASNTSVERSNERNENSYGYRAQADEHGRYGTSFDESIHQGRSSRHTTSIASDARRATRDPVPKPPLGRDTYRGYGGSNAASVDVESGTADGRGRSWGNEIPGHATSNAAGSVHDNQTDGGSDRFGRDDRYQSGVDLGPSVFDRKAYRKQLEMENREDRNGGFKRQRVDRSPRDTESYAGRGRGRGRGRGLTLPAWMTDQGNDGPHGVQSQDGGQPPSEDKYQQEYSGTGRGRGRTLPSWMTSCDGPRAEADTARDLPRAAFQDLPGSGGGRGRGRTLPAWMTQSRND